MGLSIVRNVFIAAFVIILGSRPDVARAADDCAWRQAVGSCSARISLDRERSQYTITVDTPRCVRVGAVIDQTVYTNSFRGGTYVGDVTIFHKDRDVKVGIDQCNVYETKAELEARCVIEPESVANDVFNKITVPKNLDEFNKNQKTIEIVMRKFIDDVNFCIGDRVLEYRQDAVGTAGNDKVRVTRYNFYASSPTRDYFK